jgi:outer membrane lipoprotein carrier protein
MFKVRFFWPLLSLCLLFANHSLAQTVVTTESGYQLLDRFINSLETIQAEFTQVVKDARDQELERSVGKLLIKRPGRFRWEYTQPNQQTLVSDGQRLWIYDAELEQVTVNRVDATLEGTPAILLSGKDDLRKNFEIEHVEQRSDATVIHLAPKSASNSDFKSIQVVLRGEQLMAMSLTDKLGQTSTLQLTQCKRNLKLSDSQFIFTPPKGVDVIDNTRKSVK